MLNREVWRMPKTKMKKFILSLLIVFAFSEYMLAQKGMNSVGVYIPVFVGKLNTGTGIGIKYQYNFSDYIRGEIHAGYTPIYSKYEKTWQETWSSYSIDNGYSLLSLNHYAYCYADFHALINAHIFLISPRYVRPYIILGLGCQNYHYGESHYNPDNSESTGYKSDFTKLNFISNLGVGLDVRLNYRWTFQAAALLTYKSLINKMESTFNKRHDFGVMAMVGINYNF